MAPSGHRVTLPVRWRRPFRKRADAAMLPQRMLSFLTRRLGVQRHRKAYFEFEASDTLAVVQAMIQAGLDPTTVHYLQLPHVSRTACILTGRSQALLHFLRHNLPFCQVSIDFPEFSRNNAHGLRQLWGLTTPSPRKGLFEQAVSGI